MVWINEVDSAKHMDEFESSSSIEGRKMLEFDEHDSKIASVLKKLLTSDFMRRVYMIFDYFKISGTGEALVDFNDLLTVWLKNDNVQGVSTKRDR